MSLTEITEQEFMRLLENPPGCSKRIEGNVMRITTTNVPPQHRPKPGYYLHMPDPKQSYADNLQVEADGRICWLGTNSQNTRLGDMRIPLAAVRSGDVVTALINPEKKGCNYFAVHALKVSHNGACYYFADPNLEILSGE